MHGDGALNTVRFCADLVDKRVQNYVSFGRTVVRTSGQFFEKDPQPWADRVQPAARALWDTVQASRLDVARSNPDCAIAAANAITVLNAAGIIFDHCDLSHATLGPVVGGDERSVTKFYAGLSGAVLSHANLSHACLRKASLASSCLDRADLRFANLLDVDFGQRASLLGHYCRYGPVRSVSFSPDGKYVVSGSNDKSLNIWSTSLNIWSTESGEVVRTLNGPTESGEVVRTLNGHTSAVYSVSFSPDGKYVVSGSGDKSVKIWTTESGEVVRTLNGHTSAVNSVSFSPDGKYVASGSGDKSVKIWTTESGEVVRTLNGHTFCCQQCFF
ncbi:unannotated protein [freshwater metagenome]|uniref:Unannotated protein n=1 Tax=freshwater metagenome TaxID=449393 RepID=A0A6J7H4L4_9ZZZZ